MTVSITGSDVNDMLAVCLVHNKYSVIDDGDHGEGDITGNKISVPG